MTEVWSILKIAVLPLILWLGMRLLIRHGREQPLLTRTYWLLQTVALLACVRLGVFFADVETYHFPVRLLTGSLLFLLAFLALRLAENYVFGMKLTQKPGKNLPVFFRDVVRFIILVMVVIVLLKEVFGVDPSALVVTSTVMSAVIGLALQDVLANIVAGVVIQTERPFEVGDWVNINQREGKIMQMSWRSTLLRTRQGNLVLTPNAAIAQQDILNFDQGDRRNMLTMTVGASYDDAPNKVKSTLLHVIGEVEGCLTEPAPSIYLTNYGNSGIDYQLRVWIDHYEHAPDIRDQVMAKIWYAFRREGITIPFPIRTLHFNHQSQLDRREQDTARGHLSNAVAHMKKMDILALFGDEALEALCQKVRLRLYGKDEYLVTQGDQDSSVFIIDEGEVAVLLAKKGKTREVGRFGPGYFFGEMALLTGAARSASVKALVDTRVIVIGREDFEPLIKAQPEAAERLSEILRTRTQELDALDATHDPKHGQSQAMISRGLLNRIQAFFNL